MEQVDLLLCGMFILNRDLKPPTLLCTCVRISLQHRACIRETRCIAWYPRAFPRGWNDSARAQGSHTRDKKKAEGHKVKKESKEGGEIRFFRFECQWRRACLVAWLR